ncbi:phage portal protein [Escherichia coli]|uniref:phage portal protein n=1 Tax=Escherichia coli TaxID=562 RepID=UPI001931C391|nr:phage portal protein [Escherichia coli]MBL7295964.1 phage portal protein [Escherichia coli]QSC45195.1 phage portal protein [Escherichia coli]
MFNFFKRKKDMPVNPVKKIGIRQHRKLFVDRKIEEFTKDLHKRSLGLVESDRIEGSMARNVITGSINAAIKGSASRLYNQGRQLALHTSIGSRYCQHVIDSVVGTGLQPRTFVMKGEKLDATTNTAIENAFWRWASSQKRFSRNGKINFLECLKLMEKERVMGGDAFLVLHEDGKDLQVSIYGADHVDWADQRTLDNGNVVYGGIEYEDEKPVAYWFRRRDMFTQSFSTDRYRIPAERVFHYFIPSTAEALRGVTDFLPIIKDIAHLEAFRETVIIGKRVHASSMAFITSEKENQDSFDVGEDEPENNQPPTMITDFEPGTINVLEPGQDIKTVQSASDGDDFETFNEAMLTSISMGLSSYKTALTGDTSSVNFSAARFGSLMEKNRFKAHQDRLIDTVILPLFQAFLEHAVINSKLNIRMTQIESIIDVTSVSRPKVESVDPVKDISAEIMMLENGLKSKSQIITEMGYDVAQTFKQIESEKHMLNTCVVSEGETEKEKSPYTQNE